MAVIAIEGFDLYNGTGTNTGLQSKWLLNTGVANMALVAGRFGGQALQSSPSGGSMVILPLPATYTTVAFGFALRFPALPASALTSVSYRVGLVSGTTWTMGMQVDANGAVNVARATNANAGTQLGVSANGTIQANVWHYVEVEFVLSDTVGRITVYVDGVQVINVTNVDTNNAVGTVNGLIVGSTGASSNAMQIDDMYVVDAAAKLGERRVETIRPTADTATKTWVPSTGANNYATVDDTTADATDYVQGSNVGDTDLYELADITGTPSSIDAVQYNVFAMKTDAGSRSVAMVGDIAGTQDTTPSVALASSVSKISSIRSTKPGGGAWDAASVNALRLGPKVAA